MVSNSKDLLELECTNNTTSSSSYSSSLESKLLLCKPLIHSKAEIPKPDKKPEFSSVPKSQVLGKVKDFLGVISEANETLQLDAKVNSEKYDIEVLKEDESEYIEMDLMLGVADLQTPEAVAAAESAIAGHQPVLSLAASSDDSESEDSSDGSDNNDDSDDETDMAATISSHTKAKRNSPAEDDPLSDTLKNHGCKKRQKIVELL